MAQLLKPFEGDEATRCSLAAASARSPILKLAFQGLRRVAFWGLSPCRSSPRHGSLRGLSGQVAVGIDAKGGKVAVEGWAEASRLGVIELAKKFEGAGVASHHLYRYRP